MTWRELAEEINDMGDEQLDSPVLVWGEDMPIRSDCELRCEKEDMYFSHEWDECCLESELEPEDKNNPDVYVICEAGTYHIFAL